MGTHSKASYPHFVTSSERASWDQFVSECRSDIAVRAVSTQHGVVELAPLDKQKAFAEKVTEEAFRNWLSFGNKIKSILSGYLVKTSAK